MFWLANGSKQMGTGMLDGAVQAIGIARRGGNKERTEEFEARGFLLFVPGICQQHVERIGKKSHSDM